MNKEAQEVLQRMTGTGTLTPEEAKELQEINAHELSCILIRSIVGVGTFAYFSDTRRRRKTMNEIKIRHWWPPKEIWITLRVGIKEIIVRIRLFWEWIIWGE
jgi:uracil-DNA glycosylase